MATRIWLTHHDFFCRSIFVESSELIGLKFGHNVWIGPNVDNKDFQRDLFFFFFFFLNAAIRISLYKVCSDMQQGLAECNDNGDKVVL